MRYGRLFGRRLARAIRSHGPSRMPPPPITLRATPRNATSTAAPLQPGDWVQVRSFDAITATLDRGRTHRGLAFGGDMADYCGRQMQVRERVDRLIDESSGRLRPIRDTVILDGSRCDRYLGCVRGMPFLWREAWLERIALTPEVTRKSPGRRDTIELAVKRGLDIVGAIVGLIVLSPILGFVALAVWISLGRPIVFRQVRPGYKARPFTILKFRTMRATRDGEVFYATDAVRITRLGRFLRVTSIDELPELWNVLRGDMSLVGPRPLLNEYLAAYTPSQARRHDVRPGVTGWAAVHGRHGMSFDERLALDTWYVDHWNLRLDLLIIARTFVQVLRGTGVSATQDLNAVGFPLPGVRDIPASPHE